MNKLTKVQEKRWDRKFGEAPMDRSGYFNYTSKDLKQHLADELAREREDLEDICPCGAKPKMEESMVCKDCL